MLARRFFRLKILAPFFMMVAIVIYFVFGWVVFYCNDAYVTSDLVRITPQVDGVIEKVAVIDNQLVKKGQVLIQILPTPYRLNVEQNEAALAQAKQQLFLLNADVDQAQAEINSQQAALNLAAVTFMRYQKLINNHVIPRETYDIAAEKLQAAKADLAKVKASLNAAQQAIAVQRETVKVAASQLDTAKYQLSLTTLYAPATGYINNLNVYAGDYITAKTPIFGLVTSEGWRVIANYKENIVARIQPGQSVWIWLAGYPVTLFHGQVESVMRGVAREATADNAALPYVKPVTDWIRYPYRFPVRIKFVNLPDNIRLHMGADARTFILR